MKKIFFIGVLFFVFIGTVNADFEITINDTDALTNTNIIYNVDNVGPGYRRSDKIKIINTTSKYILLNLNTIEIVENDGLLSETKFTIKNSLDEIIFSGIYTDYIDVYEKLVCVSQNAIDELKLDTYINRFAGNEYQLKHFKVRFIFEAIESNKCEIIVDPDPEPQPDPDPLPDTGQSNIIYIILWIIVAVIMILILLTLRRFLKERRENAYGK